jgi:hypothetical protein
MLRTPPLVSVPHTELKVALTVTWTCRSNHYFFVLEQKKIGVTKQVVVQLCFLQVFLLQLYWGFCFTIFENQVFLCQLYCSFIEAFSFTIFKHKVFLLRLYCSFIAALLQLYWGFCLLQFSSTKCFYHNFIATLLQLYCSISISGLNKHPLPMSHFITALLWPLLWLYCSFIHHTYLSWPVL